METETVVTCPGQAHVEDGVKTGGRLCDHTMSEACSLTLNPVL